MKDPFPRRRGHKSRSDQYAEQNEQDAWRSRKQEAIRRGPPAGRAAGRGRVGNWRAAERDR